MYKDNYTAVADSKHSSVDIDRIQRIIESAAKNSPYESEDTHQVNDGFMRLITAQEYLDEQNIADYSAPISMWIRKQEECTTEAESKSSATDATMTEIDHNVGMYSAQLGHYQRDNSECEAKRSRILSCHDDKHTPPNCVRSVKPGGYEYYNTPLESPVHTRETHILHFLIPNNLNILLILNTHLRVSLM